MRESMDGTTEEKPDQNIMKKFALPVLCAAVFLAVSLGFGELSSRLVTGRIIDFSVQNLEELAMHDEQAIESVLLGKWTTLEQIGEFLKESKCTSTGELLISLGTGRRLLYCIRLTLVGENGSTLGSNRMIAQDEELLSLCRESEERFIYRMNNLNVEADGRGEELLAGVRIDPFTVEGVTYSYLVARLDIDTFESGLKLDSYNGRGCGSVIDLDGNYIVNMNRNYTAQQMGNFYSDISEGKPGDGYTPEKIRLKMEKREHFSLSFTREDGTVCMMAFIPMEGRDWYFIMSVPREVFEEQSRDLMGIFWILVGMILLSAAVIAAVILVRRFRLLAMEKKHREEMAQALALAEQASRAKTTFLSNMSHDIRTPMNAIIGFTTLALAHIDDKERVSEYLDKISESSRHLLSLVNDVLDMSRIESGKIHIEEQGENLTEILQGIQDIVQVDVHAKQLAFSVDMVDVEDEDIYCDRLRLNQILLNILSNAVKFTAPGGTISLRVTEKAVTQLGCGVYEFRIKDNGIGMSPEFKKMIFEPFTREHTSTVSGIQGTGLGMSITKNIVDMMGGTIELECEQGKGTEFIVTLEFRIQEEHGETGSLKAAGEQEERTEVAFSGKRLLLVEDNELNREIAAEILQDVGFVVETANDGQEAVDAVLACRPGYFDAVLMDIQMPVMDGYEATRRIRRLKDPVLSHIPIIAMTANAFEEDRQMAYEAGMDAHVGKPIDIPVLLHTLERILGKSDGEKKESREERYAE